MSTGKDIIIQTSGVSGSYSGVEKIITSKHNGLTVPWVPEGERTLTDIEIYQNGTYTAASSGLYGYNIVTVEVSEEAIVGTDPITGNKYAIKVDQEGNIVRVPIGN